MDKKKYSLFFIALFCILLSAHVMQPCLAPNNNVDAHADIEYINKEIRAYANKSISSQEHVKKILKEHPEKALMPEYIRHKLSTPLYIAAERDNKEIVRHILGLSQITITPDQKYLVLYRACVHYAFDVAIDLMKNYKIPIMLSNNPETIQYSLINPLITYTWYLEFEEILGRKSSYFECLNHVLSEAKKKLSEKDFYQFTRYCQRCPYQELEFHEGNSPGKAISLAVIRTYFINNKVRCSGTKKCEQLHPDLLPHFLPIQRLLNQSI
jgi:hypothetical protein